MKSILALTPRQRRELYSGAAQALGIGEIIIEKDFWVCWTLQQLFTLPGIKEHLIFKGGTSLSKVWKAIERFSEDIDISFSREWLGFSGELDPEKARSGKKQRECIDRLANACAAKIQTEVLPSLSERITTILGPVGWTLAIDDSDPQTLLFAYPTDQDTPNADAYIRREVKIECGARSDIWPAETRSITPYVAEPYQGTIKDAAVSIKVLSIERTFWEKATILHAEAHRDPAKPTPARFSRHYADMAALIKHPCAAKALQRDDLRARVVEHKQIFFPSAWANYETAIHGTFKLIPPAARLTELETDYRAMQEMFFGTPRTWSEITNVLQDLEIAINTPR